MPLPHFTQLVSTGHPNNPKEPVYKNLFEITFILPTILQAQGRNPLLLLEQATKINLGLTNKELGIKEQRFKFSTRAFIDAGPQETHIADLDIPFQVNVNDSGAMETWNTLRAWYDLAWNSQNGYTHYKKDLIGTIIVNQHDKKGRVLRRVTFNQCQLRSVDSPEMDWETKEIFKAETKFVSDYWIDEYIDGAFTIQPPFVAGY